MTLYAKLVLLFVWSLGVTAWSPGDSNPHIIYILADDLGYNDVSWNNANILTPNMATLASSGIKLDSFYAQPVCSPSRSALLTGYYPIHTGFNEGALAWGKKAGIESTFTTISEVLKNELGYSTYMLGKWHVGWCKSDYLPTGKGFDTHYGIWQAGTDHYYYVSEDGLNGYDFHYGEDPYTSLNGTYSSYVYSGLASSLIASHDTSKPMFLYVALQNVHTPLEAPAYYLSKYANKGLTVKRKRASAMVSAIDDVVGGIYDALDAAGMLSNSIIVFSSDNGGQPTVGGANNLPLRGAKDTWFEGGMRVPSFIYSPLFSGTLTTGVVNSCLFHISDMYTTLLKMAGYSGDLSDRDGVDQWDSLESSGSSCARDTLLHNIIVDDDGNIETAAYRKGSYKFIYGDAGTLTNWYNVDQSTSATGTTADYYLFNIDDDPEETTNLAYESTYADTVSTMLSEIKDYISGMYTFPSSGTCTSDQALDDSGAFVTGCCASSRSSA